jgi:hypothetical protein
MNTIMEYIKMLREYQFYPRGHKQAIKELREAMSIKNEPSYRIVRNNNSPLLIYIYY